MQLHRVVLLVGLLAGTTITAYAGPIDPTDPILTFSQSGFGGTSVGATFNFTSISGSDCGASYPGCNFINGTNTDITEFQVVIDPTNNLPLSSYTCVDGTAFFNSCTVTGSSSSVTMTFFNTGSSPFSGVPVEGAFNLGLVAFGPGTTFSGDLETPELGSLVLLLTALAGILVVRRRGLGTGNFGA
jgi:hypothetical protein